MEDNDKNNYHLTYMGQDGRKVQFHVVGDKNNTYDILDIQESMTDEEVEM